MRKHILRYLIFLLPALAVALLARPLAGVVPAGALAGARWFFAFFMIFGYGLCTAVFAYRHPRAAAAFILYYTGFNLLVITAFYSAEYGAAAYGFLRDYGGALSYVPLGIMVEALLDFNIRHEVVVSLILAASMGLGFLGGVFRRRSSPDPYRPTIG
jgi:hypothetical protein